MAGLLNNILDYIRVNDEDDYDEYDDYESVKEEPVISNVRTSESTERKFSRRSHATDLEEEKETTRRERAPRADRNNKVVPMRGTSKGLEVCIVKPTSFEDSQQVCDILLDGRACVVNLEGFDADEAQRIMDFISGCIFAIAGNMCQVSRYIFIFSPKGVEISGDYLKSLENDQSYNIANFNKEF